MFLTLLRMISGARYSGVPHRVHVLPLTRLAKPKSVIWKKVKNYVLIPNLNMQFTPEYHHFVGLQNVCSCLTEVCVCADRSQLEKVSSNCQLAGLTTISFLLEPHADTEGI